MTVETPCEYDAYTGISQGHRDDSTCAVFRAAPARHDGDAILQFKHVHDVLLFVGQTVLAVTR